MPETSNIASTYTKIEQLSSQLKDLLAEVAQHQKQPDALQTIDQVDLSDLFSKRRDSEDVTVADLELQTNIPASTLRRVLNDPQKATFQNVSIIARELGVKIWIEK